MRQNLKIKATLKLLIGVASLKGEIEPKERDFLVQFANQYQLTNDPEIKPLLYGLKKVEPSECYDWLETYLDQNSTHEDYLNLLQVISQLIYRNNYVANSEAKLLMRLQQQTPQQRSYPFFSKLLKKIQKFYKKETQEKI